MKKINLLIITLLLFVTAQTAYAQSCDCTPNPTCEDENNPGEVCPETPAEATAGDFYEQSFTIIPPSSFLGLDVIHSIRIDSITGLPEGFEWCKNEDIFLVTEPITRYCARIYGTTEQEGEYPLSLYITPYLSVFGTPVEQAQRVDDTSITIIVLPAIEAPVADFSANLTSVEVGNTVNFTDESTNEPTSWSWEFEGGTPATSTEENPTVTYSTAGEYSVTLVATNNGGTNEITKEDYITVTNLSGINQDIYNAVKIYPNPASNHITIEGEGLESISIVDMLGKVIYSAKANSDKEVIDISKMGKSNYFVKISTKEGEITKSISIK